MKRFRWIAWAGAGAPDADTSPSVENPPSGASDPSKLARSFPKRSSLDQFKRARVLSFSHRLDVEPAATCEGGTAPLLRSIFIDGETHCSTFQSSFQACFSGGRLPCGRRPSHHIQGGGNQLRLRWVQGPVAAVACGDGETHCSKVRSDEVQDGPSCGAKQRKGRAFYPSRSSGFTSTLYTLLVCALGEQRKLPSLPIHHFAEPRGPCGFTHRWSSGCISNRFTFREHKD